MAYMCACYYGILSTHLLLLMVYKVDMGAVQFGPRGDVVRMPCAESAK